MTPVPKPGSVPVPVVEPKDREDLPGILQGRTRGTNLVVEAARHLQLPRAWMATARVASAQGGPSWLELFALRAAKVLEAACTGSRKELRVELEAAAELCATWADAVERRG